MQGELEIILGALAEATYLLRTVDLASIDDVEKLTQLRGDLTAVCARRAAVLRWAVDCRYELGGGAVSRSPVRGALRTYCVVLTAYLLRTYCVLTLYKIDFV